NNIQRMYILIYSNIFFSSLTPSPSTALASPPQALSRLNGPKKSNLFFNFLYFSLPYSILFYFSKPPGSPYRGSPDPADIGIPGITQLAQHSRNSACALPETFI